MLRACNIIQRQPALSKAYEHLTWHRRIWKTKFGNEMQDLQGHARIAHGVFELLGRHMHCPLLGSVSQGF